MLNGQLVYAVVPARGGSKSVPGKNIRPLAGKPLLAWSIAVARAVPEIDRILLSTDDAAIAAVGAEYGAEACPRPAHLATDTALVIDALRDLLARLRAEDAAPEWMILLEPTCPLRTAEDVAACLRLAATGRYDSVATFTEAALNPHRAWRIEGDQPKVFIPGAVPWLPRQKLPLAWQLNGAVYLFRSGILDQSTPALLAGRTGAVVMPRERSHDIDDLMDFTVVETLLQSKGK